MEAPRIIRGSVASAARVRQVYDLMGQLGVSLYDLETIGYVDTLETTGSLTTTANLAYDALIESGYDHGWQTSHLMDHYMQAGQDAVQDALDELNLIDEEE